MKLPQLPAGVSRTQSEPVGLRGINYSDDYAAGDLAESTNLSARRYPVIATRPARVKQAGYSGVTALGAWEALAAVSGTKLLFNGQEVGSVTAGAKQFAVVNTKLVIWPDKKYLDMDSMTVKDLGASLSGNGGTFAETTLTVSGWGDLTNCFQVGDTVEISGCTAVPANNKSVTIKGLTANVITVESGGFTAGTETGRLTVARNIPDLDFICESENRLWGCSNGTRSIYASALGDPTNFYTYEALSTDSYAVAVGSEGEFTGCCRLSGAVLFWKERKLHKLLGSYPAEYALVDYDIEGVRAGCHKSQTIINDMLYYVGLHGVYRYNGGTPQNVSAAFGAHDFGGAVGGTDGERYYLSVTEGTESRLMVYDTRYGMWLREDGTRCADFARLGSKLYFCDSGGSVWLAGGGSEDPEIAWEARYQPMYETISGRKRYRKLILRAEVPKGAYLIAECSFDGKPWKEFAKITGKTRDAVPLEIPIARVDRIELRLRGKGPCAILGMTREFSIGSDR